MRRSNFEVETVEHQCPNCGSNRVQTQIIRDKFEYGSGAKATTLEASIPYRRCADCGFEYTDYEAEDVQHEAVCRYLQVMTPPEIKSLRKKYNFTRAEFAELTRIGEASLARWESSEVIQNAANDDYLYLLTFPENLRRLQERRQGSRTKEAEAIKPLTAVFRMLDDSTLDSKLREEDAFELRDAA
jgi:putative zinc finger/helix-turn-helix YgiT family protein